MPLKKSLPLLFFIFLLCASPSWADIYKYTDSAGKDTYTNDPRSIPPEYKSKAQVVSVSGQTEPDNSPSAPGGTPAVMGNLPAGQAMARKMDWSDSVKEKLIANRNFYKTRAFEIFAGITVFVAGFLLIGKLSASLGLKAIGTVLRIALLAVVMLFLFRSYLSEISDSFTDLKGQAEGIKNQTESRNSELDKAAGILSGDK